MKTTKERRENKFPVKDEKGAACKTLRDVLKAEAEALGVN